MDDASADNQVGRREAFGFSNKLKDIADINFVDDDDLQSGLDRARKLALKEKKKTTEEDFVESKCSESFYSCVQKTLIYPILIFFFRYEECGCC